jgi:hypothetical protein
MNFKYANEIKKLDIVGCPPMDKCSLPDLTIVYRWVFSEKTHQNNFIPVLVIKPERVTTPKFIEQKKRCGGFALSMHDTLENSINHYQNMSKEVKNFGQIVGNKVVKLDRTLLDGLCDVPSKNEFDRGHFDFFESDTCTNWITKIIGELINLTINGTDNKL